MSLRNMKRKKKSKSLYLLYTVLEMASKTLKKMEDFILATDCHFNRTLCAQDRMIDLFHFCLHGTFRVRPHLKSTLLFLPVFWILVF